MKKILISMFILAMSNVAVRACDICGCGVGNYNPHMFPHLAKNFIGLSYSYRHYHSHAHDELGNEMMNTEYYKTILLTGQVVLAKKIQLMGMLPFQTNKQTGPEGNKNLNKTGDLLLLVNYRLLDKNNNKFRHTILGGGGIKLPTGSYHFDEDSEKQVGNANFQAGTGSTDWLLNGAYNIRYRNWAATAGVTYKINTANKNDYRFGNRLLTVLQFKYIQNISKFSIIPNAGVNYEKLQQDKLEAALVEHTGGYNMQLTGGLDINSKKWAIGFSLQNPVKQDLGEGHIHAMPGGNVHLSFSF